MTDTSRNSTPLVEDLASPLPSVPLLCIVECDSGKGELGWLGGG